MVSGQVVETLEIEKVSAPFIDLESGDLAIQLTDVKGKEQKVLFNSFVGFDKFLKEHGMDEALMDIAMEARRATPKVIEPLPKRDVVDVYLESESGCLAIDYIENGVKYSSLFDGIKAMEIHSKDFGLTSSNIAIAKALEVSRKEVSTDDILSSLNDIDKKLKLMTNVQKIESPVNGRVYSGPVVAETGLHIAQSIGAGVVVVHDLISLDKIPQQGDVMRAKYKDDRGVVVLIQKESGLER
jgi:hypothetical protein